MIKCDKTRNLGLVYPLFDTRAIETSFFMVIFLDWNI